MWPRRCCTVETFMLWNPCWPSNTRTTRVENKIGSDHAGGGRMARIGKGTMITPASRLHQAFFDASQNVDVRKRGGKRAQASQPSTKKSSQSPSCEPARGRATLMQHIAAGKHTIEASEQVEARHQKNTSYHQPTWQPRASSARSSRVR